MSAQVRYVIVLTLLSEALAAGTWWSCSTILEGAGKRPHFVGFDDHGDVILVRNGEWNGYGASITYLNGTVVAGEGHDLAFIRSATIGNRGEILVLDWENVTAWDSPSSRRLIHKHNMGDDASTVAVDNQDNIYIHEGGNPRKVHLLRPGDNYATTTVVAGLRVTDGSKGVEIVGDIKMYPGGITYVSGYWQHVVFKVHGDTTTVSGWENATIVAGKMDMEAMRNAGSKERDKLQKPSAISVDSAGNLVVETYDRVMKWSPGSSEGVLVFQGYSNDVLLDSTGLVYVATGYDAGKVYKCEEKPVDSASLWTPISVTGGSCEASDWNCLESNRRRSTVLQYHEDPCVFEAPKNPDVFLSVQQWDFSGGWIRVNEVEYGDTSLGPIGVTPEDVLWEGFRAKGWRLCLENITSTSSTTSTPWTPWQFVAGTGCVAWGLCLESTRRRGGQYGNSESCNFRSAAGWALLPVQEFATESGYDKLSVNGVDYSGSASNAPPAGLVPTDVVWSSDASASADGWTLCLDAQISTTTGTGTATGTGTTSSSSTLTLTSSLSSSATSATSSSSSSLTLTGSRTTSSSASTGSRGTSRDLPDTTSTSTAAGGLTSTVSASMVARVETSTQIGTFTGTSLVSTASTGPSTTEARTSTVVITVASTLPLISTSTLASTVPVTTSTSTPTAIVTSGEVSALTSGQPSTTVTFTGRPTAAGTSAWTSMIAGASTSTSTVTSSGTGTNTQPHVSTGISSRAGILVSATTTSAESALPLVVTGRGTPWNTTDPADLARTPSTVAAATTPVAESRSSTGTSGSPPESQSPAQSPTASPPAPLLATPMSTLLTKIAGLAAWLPATLLRDRKLEVVSVFLPLGTATVARLPRPAADITVNVEGATVMSAAATVPKAVITALPSPASPEEELALLVTSLDLAGTLAPGTNASTDAKVVAMVSIDIAWVLAGDVLNVSSVPEPITFKPGVDFVPGMACAFWNETEGRWSQAGVAVLHGVPGEPLTCLTWHLSFFAALLQGFVDRAMCSNFRLLAPESLQQLLKGDWLGDAGAAYFAFILACLVLAFLVAALLDRRRAGAGWSDAYLLKERQSSEEHDDGEERDENGRLRPQSVRAVALFKHSSAVRDAMDDVLAHWIDYFSELRSLLESIMGSVSLQALCCKGRCGLQGHEAMVYTTLLSAQRLTAATVGVSDATVQLVLEEKAVHQHFTSFWSSAGSGSPVQRTWARLYNEVFSKVHTNINEHGSWRRLPMVVWRLFIARNPIGAMWTFDVLVSSKMRAFLASVELLGALYLTAVFFQASSSLRNRRVAAACGPRDVADRLGYNVGRLFVVGLGSLLLAEIPVVILHSLTTRYFREVGQEGCAAWRQQLRAWELQDMAIYALGFCYLAFAVFFIGVFLANVSSEDHFDFMVGCVTATVQDFVVVPLMTSIVTPTLSAIFFTLNSKLGKVEKSQLLREVSGQLIKRTPAIEI